MIERFKSTSKINLFLDILKKDPTDGYHFLESVFMEIPWGDDFSIRESDCDCVIFENCLEIERENTISKALRLFKEKYQISEYFEIRINKKVPLGAGLGGGSGDAGALLKYLAKRYKIDPIDCLDIAQKIGSDVPFFLYGGTALVEGKGEKITPLKGRVESGIKILIIYPNYHMSTKTAFDRISGRNFKVEEEKIDFFKKKTYWSLDNLKKIVYNVFNDELKRIDPHLHEIKSILNKMLSPELIFMTGSGSSFVLMFRDKKHKINKVSLTQIKDYTTYLCDTTSLDV